jgi:hypothetical protein
LYEEPLNVTLTILVNKKYELSLKIASPLIVLSVEREESLNITLPLTIDEALSKELSLNIALPLITALGA